MWAFVVLMIIGLILIAHVAAVKSASNAVDRDYEEMKATAARDAKVFAERYVVSQSYFSTCATRADEETSQAVELAERIQKEAGIKPNRDLVFRALVAQAGKIPASSASGFATTQQTRYLTDERKYMLWYDKELRAHGMREEMLFIPESKMMSFSAGNFGVASRLCELQLDDIVPGRYLWMSVRKASYFRSNLDVINGRYYAKSVPWYNS